MPRWLRVVRGMIGTGLTFAAGIGGAALVAGAAFWLAHRITGRELLQITGRLSVASFLLGVGFSGVLALVARGRTLEKLSIRLVAALGAGAGLVYFGLISVNGARVWSVGTAISNFVILTAMGAGAAVSMLLIARRASRSSQVEVPR